MGKNHRAHLYHGNDDKFLRKIQICLVCPGPKGPDALSKFVLAVQTCFRPNFCVFCEKICHHFRDTSEPGDFFSHQILSSITKLHRRSRPALEQDKFLSGVKTDFTI